MEKIDSVKLIRDIREKPSAQYKASTEKENQDLKTIRKKYRLGEKPKNDAVHRQNPLGRMQA